MEFDFSLLMLSLTVCLSSRLVDGQRACPLRSARCRHTEYRGDVFQCPAKGHYAVPGDVRRFYKCVGPQYTPCNCRCKYDSMCFQQSSGRCRFAFLSTVNNCSRSPVGVSTAALDAATFNSNKTTLKFHKQEHGGNEVLKPARPAEGDRPEDSGAGNHTGPADRRLAARRAALNDAPNIIEDDSIFPAWAISLLVLCVVIVLVLVVMVLY